MAQTAFLFKIIVRTATINNVKFYFVYALFYFVNYSVYILKAPTLSRLLVVSTKSTLKSKSGFRLV